MSIENRDCPAHRVSQPCRLRKHWSEFLDSTRRSSVDRGTEIHPLGRWRSALECAKLELNAVPHEIIVFWSPRDVIVLGVGTRLFGTIDRVRTVAPGWSVFESHCSTVLITLEATRVTSCVKCAGGLGWWLPATWVVMWDQTVQCSSGSTSCRCYALMKRLIVESRFAVKLISDCADIHTARPVRLPKVSRGLECRPGGCNWPGLYRASSLQRMTRPRL